MSAELLRRAAVLMRERAEAADALGKIADTITTSTCPEFADHIASWHPPVALAVADWLEATARGVEREGLARARDTQAFVVARTYLGEDA